MEDHQERASQSHVVVVDIPSLAKALEQELARHRQHSGSTPCTPTIGMVAELTRNLDLQEYDPQHVSIGPYHRRSKPIINDKLTSLDAVLSLGSPRKTVEAYLAELADDEARARSYYANSFDDMTSWEFLRMLLLDACYLLYWLVEGRGNKQEIDKVLRDVFYLVENQIPYFIVDKVHKLTFPGDAPALETIAEKLSQCILQKQQYTMATITNLADQRQPGNLLHLVHMLFTTAEISSVTSSPTGDQQKVGRWRTAMEYHISGVNLKGRPVGNGSAEARCILDVTLESGGTLVVPRLRIGNETWPILRNLVALEQQNPGVGNHVTAYCVFMSQMACTAADVGLLSKGSSSTSLGTTARSPPCSPTSARGPCLTPTTPAGTICMPRGRSLTSGTGAARDGGRRCCGRSTWPIRGLSSVSWPRPSGLFSPSCKQCILL